MIPGRSLAAQLVHSLRKNAQLGALLTVGDLKATAYVDDVDFQRTTVGQVGTIASQECGRVPWR